MCGHRPGDCCGLERNGTKLQSQERHVKPPEHSLLQGCFRKNTAAQLQIITLGQPHHIYLLYHTRRSIYSVHLFIYLELQQQHAGQHAALFCFPCSACPRLGLAGTSFCPFVQHRPSRAERFEHLEGGSCQDWCRQPRASGSYCLSGAEIHRDCDRLGRSHAVWVSTRHHNGADSDSDNFPVVASRLQLGYNERHLSADTVFCAPVVDILRHVLDGLVHQRPML